MNDLTARAHDLGQVKRWRPSFAAQWEARTGSGSAATLVGYASTTNTPYTMSDALGEYDETMDGGAFTRTLAQKPGVNFLANHSGLSLAHTDNDTLRLASDAEGLHSEASLDLNRTDARDLFLAVERGDIREMSFAFRVVKQEWSPDYTQRKITEVNMNRGDTSAVNFGANPTTSIGAMRAAAISKSLTEGRALDAEDVNMLTQALGWFGAVDMIVDEAQEALAAYLMVPNPDVDDMGDVAESNAVKMALAKRKRLALALDIPA